MNPATPQEPVWGAASAAAFDSRQWGDDIVLYVLATGETHGLVPAQSATLALLLEHPGERHTAAQWLALMTDDGEPVVQVAQQDPADRMALDNALIELHRMGVVERSPE